MKAAFKVIWLFIFARVLRASPFRPINQKVSPPSRRSPTNNSTTKQRSPTNNLRRSASALLRFSHGFGTGFLNTAFLLSTLEPSSGYIGVAHTLSRFFVVQHFFQPAKIRSQVGLLGLGVGVVTPWWRRGAARRPLQSIDDEGVADAIF
jgi:hypothetical protein